MPRCRYRHHFSNFPQLHTNCYMALHSKRQLLLVLGFLKTTVPARVMVPRPSAQQSSPSCDPAPTHQQKRNLCSVLSFNTTSLQKSFQADHSLNRHVHGTCLSQPCSIMPGSVPGSVLSLPECQLLHEGEVTSPLLALLESRPAPWLNTGKPPRTPCLFLFGSSFFLNLSLLRKVTL